MSASWVHAAIDLIAYGRPYFDLHKEKDKPWETYRWYHRKINHEWYQAFAKEWTLADPFPAWLRKQISLIQATGDFAKAEERAAYLDHDYVDRAWDCLSPLERKYWEGCFAWLILNPEILKEWAGVDVLEGKIHRAINGREVWENCPELKREYRRLRSYVKTVIAKGREIAYMIQKYGG